MTDFLKDNTGPYRGPERRSGKERRQNAGRREEIRFEPGKNADRRSGKDRRKHGGWDNIR
jgi:hypothetical protein